MTTNNEAKKGKKLPYQDRLEAKKKQLEVSAQAQQMRLQNNMEYTAKNIPTIATEEITSKLSEKEPRLGKLFNVLGVGSQKPGTKILTTSRVSGKFRDETSNFEPDNELGLEKSKRMRQIWDLIEEWALPLITTIGSHKLLTMTLGGTGKLFRGVISRGFGMLFGRSKKQSKRRRR